MIWRCPECKETAPGPGVPGRDDPCRLCAGCTLRLGRFVYRKKSRRMRTLAKKNPRLPHMWRGLDLHAELHERLLPHCPPLLQARPPTLVLECVQRWPREVGWANFSKRQIRLILWPRCPLPFALGTLVHELAHFVAMPQGDTGHGQAFRMAMVELCRDGYGVDPPMPKGRRVADLDRSVEDAMAKWVADHETCALDEAIEALGKESR